MTFALVTMLAGCAPDPVMPTPPPDPTSTPVFASDEEALAAAEELYGEYIDAENALGQGGWRDIGLVRPFVRGDALENEIKAASDLSSKGWTQQGDITFDSLALQQLSDQGHGTVELTVYLCLDVTDTGLLDAEGNSVDVSGRPNRLPLEVAIDDGDGLGIVRSEPWAGASFC